MNTRVVNLRHEAYDVYIGRPGNGQTAAACPWGNPFVIGRDGDRTAVLAQYAAWIQTQPHLLARLGELRGKRLGCFCKPREGFRAQGAGNKIRVLCHGQILAALADGIAPEAVE